MTEYYHSYDIDPDRLLRKKFRELHDKGEIKFSHISYLYLCSHFYKKYFEREERSDGKISVNSKFIKELNGFENAYIKNNDEFAEKFFKVLCKKLEKFERVSNREITESMLSNKEMKEILSSLEPL